MRALRRIAVATALPISMTACFHEEDPPPPTSTATIGPTTPVATAQPNACPASHPVKLELNPETGKAAEIAPTLLACTDLTSQSTYLRNNHDDQVRLIDRPLLDDSMMTRRDFSFTLPPFRAMLKQQQLLGHTLEPKQSVVIRQPPGVVHLSLSLPVQFAWQSWTAFQDLTEQRGQDAVQKWLDTRSKTYGAAWACGVLAFQVGSDAAKGDSWNANDTLDKVFGDYTGAADCVQTTRAAQNEGVVTAETLLSHTGSQRWRTTASSALTVAKFARGLGL